MHYTPDDTRYDSMTYNRCGVSGLKLPALSLGLWHNFGRADSFEVSAAIARKAFDLGITHFDLANNYGPPPGGAEETFGRILKDDFASHRDELIISTKAGYTMWPGPYGDWGSRKYLISSLDQSLLRLGLDYVDIFYHHRPDPETPLEETMAALDHIVRQGKALYIGISNYSADETKKAIRILQGFGNPLADSSRSVFHAQPSTGRGPAGSPGKRWRWLHRILPSGTRSFDRTIPRRNPARLPRCKNHLSLFEAGRYYTWHVGKNPNSSQYGAGAQSDIGSDGPFLGISKSWRYIRSRGC